MTRDESIEPPGPGHDAARCFAVVATLGQRDEEAAWAASRLMPAYVGVVASRKRFGHIRETLAARGAAAEQLDRIANPAGLDIGAETPEEIALSILAEITRRARARRPAWDTASAPAAPDVGRDSASAAADTGSDSAPSVTGTGSDSTPAVTDNGSDSAPAAAVPASGGDPGFAGAFTATARDPGPAEVAAHAGRELVPVTAPTHTETARDPVCGMDVAVAPASHRADVGGATWYFCCASCREQFLAEPQRYAAAAAPEG